MKNKIYVVTAAALWIGFNEFLRNQILFKDYWVDHYKSLGLVFHEKPINGIVWVIWSFVFAGILYTLLQKFTAKQTSLLGWLIGFVMMWLVIGNLGVLPIKLLFAAIPLSIIEVIGAVVIIGRTQKR